MNFVHYDKVGSQAFDILELTRQSHNKAYNQIVMSLPANGNGCNGYIPTEINLIKIIIGASVMFLPSIAFVVVGFASSIDATLTCPWQTL